MSGSLQRLGPFFAQAKVLLGGYGLPLDRTFLELRVGLVEQQGDRARVRVHYPLAGQEIDTVVSLQKRGGRWYLSDYLRHAEQALAVPAEDASAGPAPASTGLPPTDLPKPK